MLTEAGFIRDMLTDKDADALDDRQIANNAGHGFGAATCVRSILKTFIHTN